MASRAAIPAALAFADPNLVMIGDTYGNDTVFWHGNDKGTWVVVEPTPVHDAGKAAVDVISLDGIFIAANNSESDHSAVLFTSESGQVWSELVRFRNAEIGSIAKYQQGAVAVGFDRAQRSAAIWVSHDRASWTQLPITEALKDARMDLIITDGVSLIALGRRLEDDGVIVWRSSDADTWERLPVSLGNVLVRDAIFTELGVVVVGVEVRLSAAAIWTSPKGRVYRRVPHDEALFVLR